MWFSLYMLLIQFVDMHLLFLFSFFWLLLSFFFQSAIFNTMWWTFCLVQGKKKKTCDIFVIPSFEKISGDHLNGICTNTKNKQQKTNRSNNQNQTAAHTRVATAGIFQTLVGGGGVCMYDTCMRLMGATWTIRSISSSLLSPPSSLLPPSYSSSPRGVMGGLSATPVIHTTARRVSTSHWSELTAAAMRGKKHHETDFFSFSPPPKNTKKTA